MSQWSDQYWPAGTLVRVLECLADGETRYIGEGELVFDFDPADEDTNSLTVEELFENSPTIKMPDGRTVRGYQCWWIPVEVVEDIENAP